MQVLPASVSDISKVGSVTFAMAVSRTAVPDNVSATSYASAVNTSVGSLVYNKPTSIKIQPTTEQERITCWLTEDSTPPVGAFNPVLICTVLSGASAVGYVMFNVRFSVTFGLRQPRAVPLQFQASEISRYIAPYALAIVNKDLVQSIPDGLVAQAQHFCFTGQPDILYMLRGAGMYKYDSTTSSFQPVPNVRVSNYYSVDGSLNHPVEGALGG